MEIQQTDRIPTVKNSFVFFKIEMYDLMEKLFVGIVESTCPYQCEVKMNDMGKRKTYMLHQVVIHNVEYLRNLQYVHHINGDAQSLTCASICILTVPRGTKVRH